MNAYTPYTSIHPQAPTYAFRTKGEIMHGGEVNWWLYKILSFYLLFLSTKFVNRIHILICIITINIIQLI